MNRVVAVLAVLSLLIVSPAVARSKPKPKPHKQKPTAAQIRRRRQRLAFAHYIKASNTPRAEFNTAQTVIATGLPKLPATPNGVWTRTATLVQTQVASMADARDKLQVIKPPPELVRPQQDYVQALTDYHDWTAQLETALTDRSVSEFNAWASQLQSVEARDAALKKAWQTAVAADGKRLGIKVVSQ